MKDNGVEDKDIKTANYSLRPRYQYFSCPLGKNSSAKPCPPAEIVGYSISQTVSAKIRDFEKAGEILSGVIQSGVNSVSGLSFAIDDKTEIENQARQEAIADAVKKAESIAQAGNFNLGKIFVHKRKLLSDILSRRQIVRDECRRRRNNFSGY